MYWCDRSIATSGRSLSNGVSRHGRLVREGVDCDRKGRFVLLLDLVFAHAGRVVCVIKREEGEESRGPFTSRQPNERTTERGDVAPVDVCNR